MPRQKLTMQEVQRIKDLKAARVPVAQICRDFNTNPSTVYGICNGSLYRNEEGDGVSAGRNSWQEGRRIAGMAEVLAQQPLSEENLPQKVDANSSPKEIARMIAYATKQMKK